MIRVYVMLKKEFQQFNAENEAAKKILWTKKGKTISELSNRNKTLQELLNHKERVIVAEKERRREIKRLHLIENSSLMFHLGALREIAQYFQKSYTKISESIIKALSTPQTQESLSEQIKAILATH